MAKAANTTGAGTEAAPATLASEAAAAGTTGNTAEAKSRFNAALEEAKAGVAALTSEAKGRAAGYKDQALTKGDDWTAEAKTKATELAYEGKAKASEAIAGLSRVVAENAGTIDEKLGGKYGDYARTTADSLEKFSQKLDAKSVEELGADAREFVRKSPGTAVGLAAVAGFLIARIFSGRK